MKQLYSYSLFLIIVALFLTSCSSHIIKKDGPPNFYVDETKIPNATPKPERLSKFGNMKSYVVFGKRYQVIKSVRHFEQIGIASWYGTKFHHRRTSSGEPYNMLAMTAAHKNLPLPTYVQVTNLTNKRSIIVKVNDRGPFSSNRIIDLSYVAAKKLRMLGKGTARVKISAIDPYYVKHPKIIGKGLFFSRSSQPVIRRKLTHAFIAHRHTSKQLVYLQVGAFRKKLNAQRLKKRLSMLLTTPIKIYNPIVKGDFYRVKVGPIRDNHTVNKISFKLRMLGLAANKK